MVRCASSRVAGSTTFGYDRVGCSVFLNNRYQDPTTGVFISVDPLVAKTGEPYLYGSGNPTTLSDPEALCAGREGTAQSCGVDHNGRGLSRGRVHYVPAGIHGLNERGAIEYTATFMARQGYDEPLRQVAQPVPPLGGRRIDLVFLKAGNAATIVEVKAGAPRQGGHVGVIMEAAKDALILNEVLKDERANGALVDEAQWHFWPGEGGRMASARSVLLSTMSGGDTWVHFPTAAADEAQRDQRLLDSAVRHETRTVSLGAQIGTPVNVPQLTQNQGAGPSAVLTAAVPNDASSLSSYQPWAASVVAASVGNAGPSAPRGCGPKCGAAL